MSLTGRGTAERFLMKPCAKQLRAVDQETLLSSACLPAVATRVSENFTNNFKKEESWPQ